jgi:putative heme-binding domain-containing protein
MRFRSFPWGALAFALAVLALWAASLTLQRSLAIALAGLGVLAALLGLPGLSSRRDRRWLVIGGFLAAAVVLLGSFAPWVLNSHWALDLPVPETDPHTLVVTTRADARSRGRPLTDDTAADADTEAIRQDDLLIWVHSVVAGRLPDKPAKPYLLVNFKMSQLRTDRDIAVSALTGDQSPVLTDAAGTTWALVEQRPRRANITPFDSYVLIDQILIFELPPAVLQLPAAQAEDSVLPADLKLEVPASAWGRKGVCRFRIARMVDERDLTPAKLIARTKQMLEAPPKRPADPSVGRGMFTKLCYPCHTIFGFGTTFGPDLTDRGLTPAGRPRRTDLDFLLTSIIDPSAEIAKEYESSRVALTNGQVLSGIIKAQSAETVTLLAPTKAQVIRRSDIEEITPSKISLMPVDLLKGVNEHDVRSLLAYLTGPGQVPMLATPQNSLTFFNGQNLDFWRTGPLLSPFAPPHGVEAKGERGWHLDRGELVAPEPHGGSPAVLNSELLLTPPFHLRLQIRRGAGGTAAVVVYGQADLAAPALRIDFTADGRVELVNGSRGRATTAPGAVRPDVWHTLEIDLAGKRVQIHLDGKGEGVLTDAEIPERCFLTLQGPVASGQRFRFRNLDLQLPAVNKERP